LSAFDEWSWDALERAVLPFGEYLVSIERTGEIWWVTFNGNPAYFCSEGVVQGFEEFFADGAPVPVGDAAAKTVADHLLAARRPGRSTHVRFTLALPQPQRLSYGWGLDGHPIRAPQSPGPEGAGCSPEERLGWRAQLGAEWERVLVTPGHHRLRRELWIGDSEANERRIVIERAFSIAAGEHLELRLDLADESS
jgi:hypothetical protein